MKESVDFIGVGIGLMFGVAVGYMLAKYLDDVPPLTSNGKQLSAREAIQGAYRLGVSDGRLGTPYAGDDIIAYMGTVT